MSKYISEEEEIKILKDFEDGLNTVELGKKYNRNNTTIGRLLKRNGLNARNIKTKLTEQQIKEAYNLYEEELYTTEMLGNIYNVDANTISNSFKRFGFTVRPNGHIPKPFNDEFFKTIRTEEQAYYLGFLMCDGSIIGGKGSDIMRIELQVRDRIIIDILAKLLGYGADKVKVYIKTVNGEPLVTAHMSVISNNLCQDLIEKGVVKNKKGKKQIPSGVPSNLLHHTIRGMFDADGSINHDKGYIVLYGGGSMTYQIADIFNKNLNLSRDYAPKKYKNSTTRLTIYNDSDYKAVTNFLYNDATIYLDRKKPLN